MSRLEQPLGIRVVCVVFVLFAVVNIVQVAQIVTSVSLSLQVLFPIVLITALSVGYAIVSIGLWKSKPWAWRGAMILVLIGGATALTQGVRGFLLLVLMSLIAAYLLLRRELFLEPVAAG